MQSQIFLKIAAGWTVAFFTLLAVSHLTYAQDRAILERAIAAERESLANVYRATYSDEQVARQVKAAFHHALLAMDDKQRYLVLSLDSEDISLLETLGFDIEPAYDYRQRRTGQLDAVLASLGLSRQEQSPDVFATAASASFPAAAVTVTGIADFPCYATVEETIAVANQLTTDNPLLAQMIDIGDSWEKIDSAGASGYDLWVMKITNSATDAAFPDKPKLFIHSAMHAREYTTAALTLDFARKLLNEYDTVADVRWIVDYHEVHILFHMNPDGRKLAEVGLLKRKNTNTSACGASMDLNQQGVDLNRNFSFFWKAGGFAPDYLYVNDMECSETYRGPVASSEPETQAVESYLISLYSDQRGTNETDPAPADKSGLHLDIHSFSNLILYPYAHTTGLAPNGEALRRLARRLAIFNNYIPQQVPELYPLDGSSESASYGELGVAQLTYELGNAFFEQCDIYESIIKPDNLQSLLHAAKMAAKPYQLADGPYFSNLRIKGREFPDITLGSDIVVTTTVSDALFSELNGIEGSQAIGSVEYSVNSHFYEPVATPVLLDPALHAVDGSFDSSEEAIRLAIDNSNGDFGLGQHTFYLRASDTNANTGAVAALNFRVIASAYLEATIEVDCESNAPNYCYFNAARSLDTDGEIISYHWDFGDGTESVEAQPLHQYLIAGDYTVQLTVTGEDGEQAIAMTDIAVNLAAAPPTAYYTISCNGLACEFDSSQSVDGGSPFVLRRWSFGDGINAIGVTRNHNYSADGSYTVVLRLRNASGWLIDTEIPILVSSASDFEVTFSAPVGTSSGGGGSGFPMVVLAMLILAALWRLACRYQGAEPRVVVSRRQPGHH